MHAASLFYVQKLVLEIHHFENFEGLPQSSLLCYIAKKRRKKERFTEFKNEPPPIPFQNNLEAKSGPWDTLSPLPLPRSLLNDWHVAPLRSEITQGFFIYINGSIIWAHGRSNVPH